MSLVQKIKRAAVESLSEIYKLPFGEDEIAVNQTKPEFEGEYTIVLFSFVKKLKASPEQLGKELGSALVKNNAALFTGYNVIKGFLNLSVSDQYFIQFLADANAERNLRLSDSDKRNIIVEYSSPNTNKPLHLGHLRNNFLGWSVAEILKARGNTVYKTCIVNDRGIHICKSMIAWELFGENATPESTGIKGDHLVGDYYVRCESVIKEEAAALAKKTEEGDYSDIEDKDRQRLVEINELMNAIVGSSEKDKEKLKKLSEDRKEIVRANTMIMKKAQQMLVDWENGKPEVISLWKRMNEWVYKGFDETYKRIGSDFDKVYHESETYLLGRTFVDEGLAKGVFYRKEDGSVWIDLTDEGLDEKLVLRKDGTSVYITQDLGLADQKYREYNYDQSIYVIADEQNYHMKVLQLILKKLDKPYSNGIYHLSYGMVELPGGRMKSREGTVVDADDLIEEMVSISAKHTTELGKVKDFTDSELKELYDTIGLGALKFFLLRVDPKKRMIFNPEESIDFHGFTGPFIQYTHARIKSILRKEAPGSQQVEKGDLLKLEKELLLLLEQYSAILSQAAYEYNPSVLAIYLYTIAKTYNTFYTEHSVLSAETVEKKQLRLQLCQLTATTIKHGMG
ncbi:MAG TPA: arginine--tRNA ligase, partial [Flavisolibacter sp.]|nr:arginine--tRNA ligase [Flavisolibacter sp.]